MDNIGSYMQDQLKHYVNTVGSINTYIYGKQMAVSSSNYSGFEELVAAITGRYFNVTYRFAFSPNTII